MRPDREYYEMLEPDGMEFPETTSSRRVALIGDLVAIGRRSKTKGIAAGDRPVGLPGGHRRVSHRHAVLMRQPEGTWALVDQESTNGTYLNAEQEPVPPNHPIPLSDGDRIHVGAWTTVTMERLDAAHGRSRRCGQPPVQGHPQPGPTEPARRDRPARPAPAPGLGRGGPDRRRRRSGPSWRCSPSAWDLRSRPSISSGRSGARRRRRPPSRRCRATSWSSARCFPRTPLRRRHRWATASVSPRTRSTPAGSNAAAHADVPSWPRAIRGRPWPSWPAASSCGGASPCPTSPTGRSG